MVIMKDIKTEFIRDNSGNKREVIVGLKKGQKLLAKIGTTTLDDIGMSGLVFRTDEFIKGKTYEVLNLHNWDGTLVPYVVDETGCSTWATPDVFELITELNEEEKI